MTVTPSGSEVLQECLAGRMSNPGLGAIKRPGTFANERDPRMRTEVEQE